MAIITYKCTFQLAVCTVVGVTLCVSTGAISWQTGLKCSGCLNHHKSNFFKSSVDTLKAYVQACKQTNKKRLMPICTPHLLAINAQTVQRASRCHSRSLRLLWPLVPDLGERASKKRHPVTSVVRAGSQSCVRSSPPVLVRQPSHLGFGFSSRLSRLSDPPAALVWRLFAPSWENRLK